MRLFVIATLIAVVPQTRAQTFPVRRDSIVAYDVEMVRRAAKRIDSPAHWDRQDKGECPRNATTFSIRCALQTTIDLAASAQGAGHTGSQSDCRFSRTTYGIEGSCGLLFEELPIFTIRRVTAVTTGKWRDDANPVEVWSGLMADVASPVLTESRQTVDVVGTKKYPGRLVGYNRDSATTFADIQKYFSVLAERVASNALADFAQEGDSVEIEVYAGGTGVMRMYKGWYALSNVISTDTMIRFLIDTTKQVPPNALDRRIIQRAAEILSADSVWNRADDRKCPVSAQSWSIYCAMQKATIEVTGGFNHRRPAAELVRVIVEERTKGKSYEHRLMGYNNDRATTLADVRSLFAEALARSSRP